MPRTAITREISRAIGDCRLTHLARQPIDVELARRQHDAYERCLAGLGCRVERLPADETMPDSVFVEDTVVVLDRTAVIARCAEGSRRGETDAVVAALESRRRLVFIDEPGTLDGGDVIVTGRTVLVGRSGRTNDAGIDQLSRHAESAGYECRSIAVDGCLHLKSAATPVAKGVMLVQPRWVDTKALDGFECVEVDPDEPFAANALAIGEHVVYADAFPRTLQRLETAGLQVVTVDVSELAKAEGAVTCCSVLVD